jgi:hypothetical protein
MLLRSIKWRNSNNKFQPQLFLRLNVEGFIMGLFEKIKQVYPSLTMEDFVEPNQTIRLQNDSDGRGDYIAKWEHPTLARPTEEQLA